MASARQNRLGGGWMGVARTRCVCSPREQGQDPSRGEFTSSLSLWLQERVKAEELMEKDGVDQDWPDGEGHHRADHSSRSSSEASVPNGRARPTSRRHKPGSDRTQHPKIRRARDEF